MLEKVRVKKLFSQHTHDIFYAVAHACNKMMVISSFPLKAMQRRKASNSQMVELVTSETGRARSSPSIHNEVIRIVSSSHQVCTCMYTHFPTCMPKQCFRSACPLIFHEKRLYYSYGTCIYSILRWIYSFTIVYK